MTPAAGEVDSALLSYRQDGFAVLPDVLGATDLARLDRAIEEVLARSTDGAADGEVVEYEPGTSAVRRLHNPFEHHEIFREIARDERILGPVASMIGDDIALQHSKLNFKPARVGSPVAWHQDMPYFPHTNDDLVGVLIYLDDAAADNGCLEVVPGLHDRYIDHASSDGTFAGRITDTGWVPEDRVVRLEAQAGSAIFLDPLTPHRSSANRSDNRRRLLVFEYRATDAYPVYTGPHVPQMERFTHVVRGEASGTVRRTAASVPIFRPAGSPRSIFELQGRDDVAEK